MKTGIKTAAIVTALLAGAVITEARPYGQQQGRQAGNCPDCVNGKRSQQNRQQLRNQGPRQTPPQRQQLQNQRNRPQGAQQFQGRQGRPQQDIRRQRAPEPFGSNSGGQLSAEERQVAKQAIRKYRNARQGTVRPKQPPVE